MARKRISPPTAKESLSALAGFQLMTNDLTWNEYQLRELIETRIGQFPALWDRSVDDPIGLVIQAADHSPRLIIRFLNSLLDYVDENLREEDKLTKDISNRVASILPIKH